MYTIYVFFIANHNYYYIENTFYSTIFFIDFRYSRISYLKNNVIIKIKSKADNLCPIKTKKINTKL